MNLTYIYIAYRTRYREEYEVRTIRFIDQKAPDTDFRFKTISRAKYLFPAMSTFGEREREGEGEREREKKREEEREKERGNLRISGKFLLRVECKNIRR